MTAETPGTVGGRDRLDVDGVRVRYRLAGDPAARPVVLLHGIARSLEDWDPMFDRLTAEHRVLSLDLPGFGLSERTGGAYSLRSLARFILNALDTIGEDRPVHLMGNSLGGAIAMKISTIAPERVRTLVLANSAGFGHEIPLGLRVLGLGPLGPWLLKFKTRKGAYRAERGLFHDPEFVTAERVNHAMRVGRNPVHDDVLLSVAGHLGNFHGVHPHWRKHLLKDVAAQRKPTLLIWGGTDRILPASNLEAARRAFPHAQYHLFAECGHMPQIEKEEEFDALVREFLAGHDHGG
ncbi:alpha/beta fold hydrolase [Arthrobacter castelli]|uniref:alpha/beta fold hydrolase n=1 Tax=Arthrobacter castelli TaxID=271431 RepID=UPI000410BC22|nr:alpha/beta fold hydrolase [Arthrobacter castelli]